MVAKQNFSDSPGIGERRLQRGVAHTVVSADSAWTDAPHTIFAANAHGQACPTSHALIRQTRRDIVHSSHHGCAVVSKEQGIVFRMRIRCADNGVEEQYLRKQI